MSGIVPPSEPGVSALLARFAAQHSAAQHGASGGPMPMAAGGPLAAGGPVPLAAAGQMAGLQPNGLH